MQVGKPLIEKTRTCMSEYWRDFAPSLESMMLDDTAVKIHADEQAEILKLLPNICGKSILELGAGIGRYTGVLATVANHVTAVDFIDEYTTTNKRCNGQRRNVQFITADVTDLQLLHSSYDVVFSNWLLMYLTDLECVKLLRNILHWLVDGGFIFFRESCFHSSGNVARSQNPTFYRTPADYQILLEAARIGNMDFIGIERSYGFLVLEAGSLQSYIKHKGNSCQIHFLAHKVEKHMDSKDSFQQFLDQKQYTRNGVLRYEWMFGKTFLSTGGLKTTEKFIKLLKLEPEQQVLDVGCGLGGHSFYMAEKYGANVLGIDLSVNMMSVAIERLHAKPHLKNKVKIVLCDVTKTDYEDNSFDAIYSRDTLLHIEEKETLFRNFLRWLKPGGRIFFTDYSKGEEPDSEEMQNYIAQRGYHLLTKNQYEELLLRCDFETVVSTDSTGDFLASLNEELSNLRRQRSDFLKEFSVEDYEYLENGWLEKIQRVDSGQQTWTSCFATKPL